MARMLLAVMALSSGAVAQEAGPGRILERYDVADVMHSTRDYPDVDAEASSGSVIAEAKGNPGAGLSVDAICRSLLSPGSAVEVGEGSLKVRATPEEHALVRRMIEVLRRKASVWVAVELRLIQSGEPLRKETASAHVERLSPRDAEDLLKEVAGGRTSSVVTAPRLTLFSGQRGSVRISKQSAYVREYRLTFGPDGKAAADPGVGLAHEGFSFSVRPVVADAAKEEVLLEQAELVLAQPRQEAFRRIETPLGDVEDPDIRTLKSALGPMLVKRGEALLVGPLAKPWSAKGDPKLWLLMSCRVVDGAAEKQKDR